MFPAQSQPREMQFDPMIYSVFEEGERASRGVYKPNAFRNDFGYIFEKVTSKASRNDRFYKGLLPAILRLGKSCFTKE